MKKLLVIVLLVAAGGYVAWAKWGKPEKRACAHMAELCGTDKDVNGEKGCDDLFGAVRKNAPAEADKLASCINESTSCGAAVGCSMGSGFKMGVNVLKDVAQGFSNSLSK